MEEGLFVSYHVPYSLHATFELQHAVIQRCGKGCLVWDYFYCACVLTYRLDSPITLFRLVWFHTTIMEFRHLLENTNSLRHLFKEVNKWLSDGGHLFKEWYHCGHDLLRSDQLYVRIKQRKRPWDLQQTTKRYSSGFFGWKARIGVWR